MACRGQRRSRRTRPVTRPREPPDGSCCHADRSMPAKTVEKSPCGLNRRRHWLLRVPRQSSGSGSSQIVPCEQSQPSGSTICSNSPGPSKVAFWPARRRAASLRIGPRGEAIVAGVRRLPRISTVQPSSMAAAIDAPTLKGLIRGTSRIPGCSRG